MLESEHEVYNVRELMERKHLFQSADRTDAGTGGCVRIVGMTGTQPGRLQTEPAVRQNHHLTTRMKNRAGRTFPTDPLSLLRHEDVLVWFQDDEFTFRIHHYCLPSIFQPYSKASQTFAYYAS